MLFNLPQKATRRHGGAMQGLGFKNGLEWTSVYPYQNCVEILMAVQDWKYTAYFLCTRSLKTWVQSSLERDEVLPIFHARVEMVINKERGG